MARSSLLACVFFLAFSSFVKNSEGGCHQPSAIKMCEDTGREANTIYLDVTTTLAPNEQCICTIVPTDKSNLRLFPIWGSEIPTCKAKVWFNEPFQLHHIVMCPLSEESNKEVLANSQIEAKMRTSDIGSVDLCIYMSVLRGNLIVKCTAKETWTNDTLSTIQTPTNQSPTTQAPTSQSTTNQSPTTQSTTDQSPTTQSTTKQPPTTQSTTNQSPTTQSTTDQSPTTQSTTAQSPTTQSTTDQSPTTQSTTDQSPTTQSTTSQSPTTQSTTDQSPTTQSTTDQSPTTQSTTNQSPTTQSTTNQSPTTQSTTDQSQTTQSTTDQSPTTQSTTNQSPTTQTPTNQSPTSTSQNGSNATTTMVPGEPRSFASFPVPEVAGGVVAGVLLIILVIICIFCCHYRSKPRRADEEVLNSYETQRSVKTMQGTRQHSYESRRPVKQMQGTRQYGYESQRPVKPLQTRDYGYGFDNIYYHSSQEDKHSGKGTTKSLSPTLSEGSTYYDLDYKTFDELYVPVNTNVTEQTEMM